jgi:transposase
LIVREASVPGVVISDVARRHDIRPQQIYQWRRQLLGPELPVFVPVSVSPALPDGASAGGTAAVSVKVCLRNGRSLKVPSDIDRDTLRSLIACVEAT